MKICFLRESWTKVWKQIHKIKQNRFFYGMFYSWFFAIFTKKRQNLVLGWMDGYSPWNPSISGIFLKFPNFLRSKVVRQLVRQLVHSLSDDNNLVPFDLWWRQILLKSEKVSKCFFQDCSPTIKHKKISLESLSSCPFHPCSTLFQCFRCYGILQPLLLSITGSWK